MLSGWQRLLILVGISTLFFMRGESHWWLAGLQRPNVLGYYSCHRIPALANNVEQQRLCETRHDEMRAIAAGANRSILECQRQFVHNRWNCSVVDRDNTVFGDILTRGIRETAVIYALTAGGVAHAVTEACSRGELVSCRCAQENPPPQKDFSWAGCLPNIKFGLRVSREFVDARETGSDARTLMNEHNNEAGRLVVESLMITRCKCHGLSGSCSVKTCWQELPSFEAVGRKLYEMYQQSKTVVPFMIGRHTELRIQKDISKTPESGDLIYLEKSPDFCHSNSVFGSLGTARRHCNLTGPGNCDYMCCGRGYENVTETIKTTCNCRFQWCCRVSCEECRKTVARYRCNPELQDVVKAQKPNSGVRKLKNKNKNKQKQQKSKRKDKKKNRRKQSV